MAVAALRSNQMGRMFAFVLGLAAAAGAARAEPSQLTLRVLGTELTNLSGPTSRTEGSQTLNLAERRQWYGVDLDWRPHPLFSLDLGASQGRIEEVHFGPPQRGPGNGNFEANIDRTIRDAPLRHYTLAALYHPIPGVHRVDLYLGPDAGIAAYSRVFASSQSDFAYGGKIGFDVRLGASAWSLGGDAAVLTSRLRVFDDSPSHLVTYSRIAGAVAYHW